MINCEFDRRRFLQWTGASAFAALSTQLSLESLASAASSSPLPLTTPILVMVTLYGGNDGLNTVVPFTDPTYKSVRSNIALSSSQVLPFSDTLAFNAVMPSINTLYGQNKVAIVQGVSYPNPNLSHFSSMAIWQSASLTPDVTTGWIGRWLDIQPHNPFNAIGPPRWWVKRRSLPWWTLAAYKCRGARWPQSCRALAGPRRPTIV
jgi:uncharacterized protein (DUF1501 family)